MTSPAVGRPTDEELTARILDVGGAMLIADGYARLRVEHIAREAGCGKTAIYRRYPDKATLVAAIIREHISLGDMPDTGSVADDLFEHALQNQRNQTDTGDTGNGLRAMFEPDVFPRLWDDFFRARRDQGVAIIERGIARGELPADVDADLILDTIAGLTLYRQSVKGIRLTADHYRAVIAALLQTPPLRADTPPLPD
ncbi:TetR/AcrR family transcriptional regulator [Microbacterium luticocti]|uniref:TetR/AcrR family transcriptional regulator n=1 Tax=Microbacterium luticocti TaxID=451764 RepID=UPI00040F6DBD|nr:TetR/AcrR family transcriptional regulator [Microbacterium luticocti]